MHRYKKWRLLWLLQKVATEITQQIFVFAEMKEIWRIFTFLNVYQIFMLLIFLCELQLFAIKITGRRINACFVTPSHGIFLTCREEKYEWLRKHMYNIYNELLAHV
jgi:hypothetical protein